MSKSIVLSLCTALIKSLPPDSDHSAKITITVNDKEYIITIKENKR